VRERGFTGEATSHEDDSLVGCCGFVEDNLYRGWDYVLGALGCHDALPFFEVRGAPGKGNWML